MHFVLEALRMWAFTHINCCHLPIPDRFDYESRDALGVYEELFGDGAQNWGREVVYVTWLTKSFGHINGFLKLCDVLRQRQQRA